MTVPPLAFQDAVRKSRYGRKDWIVFKTRDGEQVIDYCSPSMIKQAMLASGTQGHFTILSGGIGYRINWRMGLLRIRNAKYLGG